MRFILVSALPCFLLASQMTYAAVQYRATNWQKFVYFYMFVTVLFIVITFHFHSQHSIFIRNILFSFVTLHFYSYILFFICNIAFYFYFIFICK